jgi:predicted ATP-grasp superfamily ATP-dependent carboligase
VLGGAANALSLVRSFGREGITVNVCPSSSVVIHSRYCDRYFLPPKDMQFQNYLSELTLTCNHPELEGSVILSCSDDALEFVAENHAALSKKFILERNNPSLQIELLNKQRTLELAQSANVPTPQFFAVYQLSDIDLHIARMQFPLILKPFNTHSFSRLYGSKYVPIGSRQELDSKAGQLLEDQIEFMVCEMVSGPDSAACSYYTYRDRNGKELLNLTKRCVRRNPINAGCGTYQVTEHLPEVADLGRRFFDSIDYRGYGNIEFKRDSRDGQLKVIECNSRFTAVQEQLVKAGVDSALIAYRDLTGQPVVAINGCDEHVAIWSPLADFRAFGQVKAVEGKSWMHWVQSMRHRKLVFPIFSMADPMPFVKSFTGVVVNAIKRRLPSKITNKH